MSADRSLPKFLCLCDDFWAPKTSLPLLYSASKKVSQLKTNPLLRPDGIMARDRIALRETHSSYNPQDVVRIRKTTMN